MNEYIASAVDAKNGQNPLGFWPSSDFLIQILGGQSRNRTTDTRIFNPAKILIPHDSLAFLYVAMSLIKLTTRDNLWNPSVDLHCFVLLLFAYYPPTGFSGWHSMEAE